MKKKLIPLFLAASLPVASNVASAEVTIYGKLHLSIDYLKPDTGKKSWDVLSRASRIGFKGSEDLSEGLKLIWKVESQVNMADGATYWKGRNAYLGLAGGWGTFLYGRHDTPMKMSTAKLDIFVDQMADYAGIGGLIDIRASDAIAYVSPDLSGFTFVGAVVPDYNYDASGDFGGGYSLAGMYSNGGLFIGGAYEKLDDLFNGGKVSHWRIGAGFDFSSFHIGAIYADQSDDGLYTNFGRGDSKNFILDGSWSFGNSKLKARFANVKRDNDVNTLKDSKSWAIGLDHNFSKRSQIYVQYVASENGFEYNPGFVGDGIKAKGFSFGMVHKF